MCFASPLVHHARTGLMLVAFISMAGCDQTPPPSSENTIVPTAQTSTASAPASQMVSKVTVKGDEELPPNHPPLPSAMPPHPTTTTGNPSDLNQQLASLHPSQTAKTKMAVAVPDDVKGKWASVTLAITIDGTEKIHKLAIGDTISMGDNLQLHLVHFLPAYNSDEQTVTSLSNKPVNPAVQLQSISNGQMTDEGWVFQKLPEFNSFRNQQFKVRLVSAERTRNK